MIGIKTFSSEAEAKAYIKQNRIRKATVKRDTFIKVFIGVPPYDGHSLTHEEHQQKGYTDVHMTMNNRSEWVAM